ncbi:MAG: dextranase [Microbacteriaceae bacterium]|nr:dextranase [Microbacteriaceae bacterium]
MTIEARGASTAGTLTLWRLGELTATVDWDGTAPIVLGRIPEGSYGVEFASGQDVARTAVEVADDQRTRLRYGFVVDYSPGRDLRAVSDTVRRLHLTGVQFYDWAYRHADLLGGGEDYRDALGQPISLQTVRDLIETVRSTGSRALGYAAVYAAGPAEWDAWKHDAILTAGGEPYALGDFLFLVDPAAADWLESFTGQLSRATEELGFDGFHLDQYGYPKRAIRADGDLIDLASSFSTLIDGVRAALPEAHLVFNNVNDFPTWVTARSPQDAVYIEVWPPQVTLDSLARVVSRARSVAEGKPVVIAAYQHVYDSAVASAADLATEFTMATLFSHGATHLLAGEADRILVDPYYVRNHVMEASTERMLARWYDFLVEHDELLLDHAIVDVTSAYAGQYNQDCDVKFGSFDVTETAVAGAIWRRVTTAGDRLVLHLINLTGQTDTLWDAARASVGSTGPGVLRFRRTGDGMPRVRVADPDETARLMDVEVSLDGDFAVAELPKFAVWQLVVIEVTP